MNLLKDNIVELLFLLGLILIVIPIYMADIRLGLFVSGLFTVLVAGIMAKGGD